MDKGENVNMKKLLRRKKDGKFYRGAKLWPWCKNWRNAAVLSEKFWLSTVVKTIKYDYELVTLDDIL